MQNSNLPPGWQEMNLGKITNIYLGGTPARKNGNYWNGDIKWISIQDIVNAKGRYIRKTTETISQKGIDNSAAKVLPKDSIIVSSRGTVGEIGLLGESMSFNQSCYGFISKNNEQLDQTYLFYSLKNAIGRAKQLAHGGVFNTFTKETFDYVSIKFPTNISKQKQIASTLSSFDDKIELNNKIAKTLEDMASAVFKEWFVKFRFPGWEKVEFVDSELGKIPKGWEAKNVMKFIKKYAVGKKYDNKNALKTGKVPILDQGESGFIGFHNEDPSVLANFDDPIIIFTNHTCNYRLITYNFSCIQNVIPYRAIGGYSTYFVFYLTRNKIKMNDYKGHWPEFEAQNFILPNIELADKFTTFVKPIITKIRNYELENQKLVQLRDLLLPKLMKGEIRV